MTTNSIIELDENGRVGEWVPAERVHPLCNISGRKWRSTDGREGVFYDYSQRLPPRETLLWWFPETRDEGPRPEPEPKTPARMKALWRYAEIALIGVAVFAWALAWQVWG